MSRRRRCRQAGLSLVELMVAIAVLAVTALILTGSWTMASRASHASDQSLAVEAALQATYDSVADVAFVELLSWDGVTVDRGDHTIAVLATLVAVGVVQLEFTATERSTGAIVGRLATLRSGEA